MPNLNAPTPDQSFYYRYSKESAEPEPTSSKLAPLHSGYVSSDSETRLQQEHVCNDSAAVESPKIDTTESTKLNLVATTPKPHVASSTATALESHYESPKLETKPSIKPVTMGCSFWLFFRRSNKVMDCSQLTPK
jgi:hypothetical protein